MQLVTVFGRLTQAVLQAPQCVTSREVSVSHPLAGLLSQSAKGAVQDATAQVPFMHEAAALATWQRLSHIPQWAVLAWVSTHAPEQQLWVPGHGWVELHPVTQVLPTQRVPEGQCWS